MKKFFLLVIAGAGLSILFWGYCIFQESQKALHWPQTKGDVVSSSLLISDSSKFAGMNVAPARWYGVNVWYEYSVGDKTYVSNRISFQNGRTSDPKEALKVMNKYRWHPQVMVYYDPNDAEQSVLEPGDINGIFIPLIIGAVVAFWGLFHFYGQTLKVSRSIDSYVQQGQIYQEEGKWKEAIREYNQVIEMAPDLALGFNIRGGLCLQQKFWDQAIVDFDQALFINPDDAAVYFMLANAYLGKEEYDKAWANMHKAMDKGFDVKAEILEDLKKKLALGQ